MHYSDSIVKTCLCKFMQGWPADDSDGEWDSRIRQGFGSGEDGFLELYEAPIDVDLDMPAMVEHTFHIYDGIVGSIGASMDAENEGPELRTEAAMPDNGEESLPTRPAPEPEEAVRGVVDEGLVGELNAELEDDDIPAMEATVQTERNAMEESARTPLFAGAKLTQLSCTLLLLNCLRTHGASNALVNELFQLLADSILPGINSLPRSEYAASKMLKQLGLAYDTIHVCPGPRACMLFRGPINSMLERCSKCGADRYKKVGKSRVPLKVLRHFPLIPRLERMYSTPVQASFMTSHARLTSTDDTMRGAYDSHQWKYINWRWWNEFAKEDRNLRLGMATDGVNPFSVKRSTHSTWPVLIINYNLPPWMTTKKHFLMLSLIIPGKRSVTGDFFDTYLEPLLEELQLLWTQGVRIHDAANYKGSPTFLLKAILMWTCHDFPAYGVVAGVVTKGYRGCPVCGKNTISRRSVALKKQVYDNQYRRWLPSGHPWRTNREDFDGNDELRGPPDPITAEDVQRWGRLRQDYVLRGGAPASEDLARQYGVKRISSLFSLPYWQVISLTIS